MYADIKVAQDMYIFPLLGTALFNKLQGYINSGDWTGGTDYKTLMDNYLIDCLIWYTLAESPETMSYQLTNKGIVRKQGDNTQLPTMAEIVSLADNYRKRAEFYANRCKLYLLQNAPTKFPEYLNSGSGIDDKRPEKRNIQALFIWGLNTPVTGRMKKDTRVTAHIAMNVKLKIWQAAKKNQQKLIKYLSQKNDTKPGNTAPKNNSAGTQADTNIRRAGKHN